MPETSLTELSRCNSCSGRIWLESLPTVGADDFSD